MFRNVEPFFVQENPRGVWHVETPDNPERMLCGARIPIKEGEEGDQVKIQRRWGTKPCLWCKKILDDETDGAYSDA